MYLVHVYVLEPIYSCCLYRVQPMLHRVLMASLEIVVKMVHLVLLARREREDHQEGQGNR